MSTENSPSGPGFSFLPEPFPAAGATADIEDYRPRSGDRAADDSASQYSNYVPGGAEFPRSAYHLRHSAMTLPEYNERFVSNEPLAKRSRLRLKRGSAGRFPAADQPMLWLALLNRIGPAFQQLAEKAQALVGEAGPKINDDWAGFIGAMTGEDELARPEDPAKRLLDLFQDLERCAHSVHAKDLIGEFNALPADELIEKRNSVRPGRFQRKLEGHDLARKRAEEAQRLTAGLRRIYQAAKAPLPQELGQLAAVVDSPQSNRLEYNKALTALFRQVDKDAEANPLLERQFDFLAEKDLSAFFEIANLGGEKKEVVYQAIVVIEQLYAHLPYKRARYAIDPVQRLRLLHSRLSTPAEDGGEGDGALTEMQFHEEMFEIFKSLRDPHTYYQLPPIYEGHKAFLPFLMAAYGPAGSRRFVVTQVAEWFCGGHPHFRRGAEITHWNGLPIEEAVLWNGEREGGNSVAARFARGLLKMTVRTLRFGMPPKEEWVHLRYLVDGRQDEPREIILPWLIWTLRDVSIFDPLDKLEKALEACTKPGARRASASGESDDPADDKKLSVAPDVSETNRTRISGEKERRAQEIERLRRELLKKDINPYDSGLSLSKREIEAAWNVSFDPETESYIPDVFEFRLLKDHLPPEKLQNRDTGYIRIRSFSFSRHQDFVDEFRRILRIMETRAPDGLIVDVRGNGGGTIRNGERILQLLSPRTIVPEKFHFLASPLTRAVASKLSEEESLPAEQARKRKFALRDFGASTRASARESLISGELLVREGQFITSEQEANDIGQEYHGPVALIIDALSYSTTDMFAAGFQDHEIGPLIGVDANTGGGGANVWDYERDLMEILGPVTADLKPTPDGTRMGVAVRRCYRSGENAGLAIEDVGVRADLTCALTREDLVPADGQDPENETGKYRELLSFVIDKCFVNAKAARLSVTPGNSRGLSTGPARTLGLSCQTENIDRLEFYVNGIPQCTATVPKAAGARAAGAPVNLEIPLEGIDPANGKPIVLEVRGYRGENRKPVAALRQTHSPGFLALGPEPQATPGSSAAGSLPELRSSVAGISGEAPVNSADDEGSPPSIDSGAND